MSVRDLLVSIGIEMDKDMSLVIETFDLNYITTVDVLGELKDEEFKQLNVPIGVVIMIKKALANRSQNNKPAAAEECQSPLILARQLSLKNAQKKGKLFIPNERIFILVGNQNYAERRDEAGYEGFIDLPEVDADLEKMRKGLLSLGVLDSEIIVLKDADFSTFSMLLRD